MLVHYITVQVKIRLHHSVLYWVFKIANCIYICRYDYSLTIEDWQHDSSKFFAHFKVENFYYIAQGVIKKSQTGKVKNHITYLYVMQAIAQTCSQFA